MKRKITQRDILFFFFGFLFMLLIELIVDFDSCKKGFLDGFNDARNTTEVEK